MFSVHYVTSDQPQPLHTHVLGIVVPLAEVSSNLAVLRCLARISQVFTEACFQCSLRFTDIEMATFGASDDVNHIG